MAQDPDPSVEPPATPPRGEDWPGRGVAPRPPAETLAAVRSKDRLIEDFRPLHLALEWRIAELYWQRRGVQPFARNEVPFVINNSGRLSETAAALLLASCQEAPPAGSLTVLELGAGTGLFARHLLDGFRNLCERGGHDYYRRLNMVVTDGSPATIEHWRQRGLFDGHQGHVTTRVADATAEVPVAGPLRAAFCNYVLDVLPAAIVRTQPDGRLEQMCVRTHLIDDEALVRDYTTLGLAQLRELARSSDPADLEQLFALLTLFEYEIAFRPHPLPPAAEPPVGAPPGASPVLFNFAAIECLSRLGSRLEPAGFLLVNDYGPTRSGEVGAHTSCQRFGSTSALGVNFPLVEDRLARQNLLVLTPTGDEDRAIHARLVLPAPSDRLAATFEDQFGAQKYRHVQAPMDEARADVAAGRIDDALVTYRVALDRNPRDWVLIGEVADFVAHHVRDHAAALELARAAIDLNPVYSAWLWNVLGDALYFLGRFAEAHQGYLQAERIDPQDGRTNLNLAYSFLRSGHPAEALRVIARGLASDPQAVFRAQLLDKQQEVLAAIAARAGGEAQRLLRRQERFSSESLWAGPPCKEGED
jgi:Flp pilus assembly protein TadD